MIESVVTFWLCIGTRYLFPVNQPEKIDQSDSFLSTKVLAC